MLVEIGVSGMRLFKGRRVDILQMDALRALRKQRGGKGTNGVDFGIHSDVDGAGRMHCRQSFLLKYTPSLVSHKFYNCAEKASTVNFRMQ